MNTKYFICGEPKSGKTTILLQLARELKAKGFHVGGFVSPSIKEHGTREGFYVQDIETGERIMLADMGGGGPRVGKYHVSVDNFESEVLPILKQAEKYDVIIIDEIGKMELESIAFEDRLDELLQGNAIVVASLQPAYRENYESMGEVFTLGGNNKNEVYSKLLRKLVALPKGQRAKVVAKAGGKKAAVKKIVSKKSSETSGVKAKTSKAKATARHSGKKQGFFEKILKFFRF